MAVEPAWTEEQPNPAPPALSDFVADPVPLATLAESGGSTDATDQSVALPPRDDILTDDGIIPGLSVDAVAMPSIPATAGSEIQQSVLVELPLDLLSTFDIPLGG